MGLASIPRPSTSTPRHRADVHRPLTLDDLRRAVAHLLSGRDLYADDEVLRASLGEA